MLNKTAYPESAYCFLASHRFSKLMAVT
jgi:hypothetical protein